MSHDYELCDRCGGVVDPEVGCLKCDPEESRQVLDAPVIALRNVSEMDYD